ncbi:hypothetical protein PENSPDRAFT_683683 [Peniophora sp. CONT]|nr:hypothetical protein PENSPDRAFT_683683 [Peniophora sp. CONT]
MSKLPLTKVGQQRKLLDQLEHERALRSLEPVLREGSEASKRFAKEHNATDWPLIQHELALIDRVIGKVEPREAAASHIGQELDLMTSDENPVSRSAKFLRHSVVTDNHLKRADELVWVARDAMELAQEHIGTEETNRRYREHIKAHGTATKEEVKEAALEKVRRDQESERVAVKPDGARHDISIR